MDVIIIMIPNVKIMSNVSSYGASLTVKQPSSLLSIMYVQNKKYQIAIITVGKKAKNLPRTTTFSLWPFYKGVL